jgi:O-antigen/teichoic acid export membrane protein
MNRYKKLIANSGMVALGNFGSKLVVYFLIRFYTAYLTPDMYSTADLITQTAKLLRPFIALSISEAIFRFALDKNEDKKQVFSAGIYTYLVGSLILIPVVLVLWAFGLFEGYIYLLVLYVLAANIHGICTMYIRSKDHYKFFAIQGIINTATMAGLNILFLAGFGMGIEGYVLSGVIADVVTTTIVVLKEKLWQDIVVPSKLNKATLKKMLKYSIPIIPTHVIWWVTNVSDRYMVSYFSGDTENGLYSVDYKIPSLLVLVCSIFIQAWNFSSVSEENEEERRSFFSTVFSAYSAVQFLGSSFIIIFVDILVKILFDPSYHTAVLFIPTLVVATAFSSLVTFQGSVYTVNKKSMKLLYTSIIAALANIVLNFVLIPESLFGIKMLGLGATGAAIATFLSYFLVFAVRVVNIKKDFPFDMKLGVVFVNTLCVGAQCVIATLRPEGYILYQLPFVAIIFVMNFKPLLTAVKKVLFKNK